MTAAGRRDDRRRALARRALWTEHPLCQLYAIANGVWIDGRFYPAGSWSLRELIAFASMLPDAIVRRIAEPPA